VTYYCSVIGQPSPEKWNSPVTNEDCMRPGNWQGSVLGMSFRVLIQFIGCQVRHQPCKTMSFIPNGSLLEEVEKENYQIISVIIINMTC